MKCTQHIRVDKMIVRDIRVNAIVVQEIGNNFFNVPYTLGSMQYTKVIQEIGKVLCEMHSTH